MVSTLPLGLDVASPAPTGQSTPQASEDAVRLALRFRECPSTHGGRLLLFVPASSGDSVRRLVCETTLALGQLQDGPALVLDLEPAGVRAPWFSDWPIAAEYHLLSDGQMGAFDGANQVPPPLAYAQPIASPAAAIRFLASHGFASLVATARRRFAYVLCAVGPISDAVESLVAAALCDGVVLSVTADRTTMADIQTASRQLARVRAPVLGFVVSRQTSRRRSR
jgi:hypothetical protein